VQLLLTLGIALFVSALTVHFRDVRDLLANTDHALVLCDADRLHPGAGAASVRRLLGFNPFTHLAGRLPGGPARPRPVHPGPRLLAVGAASLLVLLGGYFFFDRLRDTLAEEV
jgi:ABC-type polysaccharide/polyol phosphate export permease